MINVLIAEIQTEGRGRMKRKWFSPPGNIHLSLVSRVKNRLKNIQGVSLVTAISASETIVNLYRLPVRIKWPNDLILNGKKLGGILIETDAKITSLVIGLGINSNFSEFPPQLKLSATTLKKELAHSVNRPRLIKNFLANFSHNYALFLKQGLKVILPKLNSFMEFGKIVKLESEGRIFEGQTLGLTERGEMIIRDANGKLHNIISGTILKGG